MRTLVRFGMTIVGNAVAVSITVWNVRDQGVIKSLCASCVKGRLKRRTWPKLGHSFWKVAIIEAVVAL